GRRMDSAVHLENIRCNGQAHGGCQAGCLVFWKEAWLKRAEPHREKPSADRRIAPSPVMQPLAPSTGCTEQDVWSGARAPGEALDSNDPTYVCQSTRVGHPTKPLAWWKSRQYLAAYLSGHVRLSLLPASFGLFI